MSVHPETIELIDDYFSRALAALPGGADAEELDAMREAIDDMRSQALEGLESGEDDRTEASRVVAALGAPEKLASDCAAIVGGRSRPSALWHKDSILSGRALGLPFDLRPPTAARVASRWWNPLDSRVLTPRLFGAGWTINFAALAARLGIVAPDDEDIPFESVPTRVLAISLALPMLLAAAMIVAAIAFQPGLPAMVPSHFGPDGKADAFEAKAWAPIMPMAMTAFGAAVTAGSWLRRLGRLARAAAGALSTSLSALSLGIYCQQASSAQGADGIPVLIAGLAAALVLPFALFIALSRVGRHYERLRNYENASKEE